MPQIVLRDNDSVVELGEDSEVDAEDSERFQVKADMSLWINVDFSNPTRATRVHVAGDILDTDDQATIDILLTLPEIAYVGNTP